MKLSLIVKTAFEQEPTRILKIAYLEFRSLERVKLYNNHLAKMLQYISSKLSHRINTFLNKSIGDRDWWIKITTTQPRCIYYFGSFLSHKEARKNCFGYIEDLAAENAQGITVEIVYALKPEILTVFEGD